MADDANPFRQVAPEITRQFDAKSLKPSNGWQDFAPEDHAHAFTVARSAGYDILADVRDAMSKAIRERQDFETFRANIEPILKAKGWWGKAIDPETGETIRLGSIRRLKTIFWANTRAAYAAGEWEKIERSKRVLPFLIYVESTAERKRPEHLAWVGIILPVDDDWWADHYPPNGWGCMCRVRQISESEAISLGYNPDSPKRPQSFGVIEFTNKRTGEVTSVPRGIDPGWNTNAGRTRSRDAANFLSGKIDGMPPEARSAAVADIAGSWLMRQIQSGAIAFDRSAGPGDLANRQRGAIAAPIGVMPDRLAAAVGAESRIVQFSVADAAKQADPAKGRVFDPATYERVQTLLDTGEAIRQGARDILLQGEIAGEPWMAVVRRAADNARELFLKTLHRVEPRHMRRNRDGGDVIREE